MTADTIAALASGPPPAAISVIRLSGPVALSSLAALIGGALPPPRRMSLRALHDPRDATPLDNALVVAFPGPETASGEDLVELHLHGGIAVVGGVLAALTALPGVRLALPGEFTRRAFANGRMDLSEVEGLADLVAAETTGQRRAALALAGGALSRSADEWRSRCLDILAEAEAGLDFAEDEADVANRIDEAARDQLLALVAELEALIADASRGQRLRNGLTIAVTGTPNVGKSSLVNVLTNRDAAIVTAIAGTTRDPIEVPIDLDGVAAVLIDTAGLRDTEDPIEAEGIRRARLRADAADLVIHLVDHWPTTHPDGGIVVVNKIDLGGPAQSSDASVHFVSAVRGDGIRALRQWLANWAAAITRPSEPPLLTHARHRDAFVDAAAALSYAATTDDFVLRAEGLRHAAHAFGRIAGRVDVDDILDRIFSRFCIGK
ncbi:MAG: tRNA uridine-5-carboxymethylaminomethyl(34) synthesis GTPase MnmE [Polymorphobacter sp.]